MKQRYSNDKRSVYNALWQNLEVVKEAAAARVEQFRRLRAETGDASAQSIPCSRIAAANAACNIPGLDSSVRATSAVTAGSKRTRKGPTSRKGGEG